MHRFWWGKYSWNFYIHSWFAPVAMIAKWVTRSKGPSWMIKLQGVGAPSTWGLLTAWRNNTQVCFPSMSFRPGAWSLQPGPKPGNRPQPLCALQPLRDHRHIRTSQPGLREVAAFFCAYPPRTPHTHTHKHAQTHKSSDQPQFSLPGFKRKPCSWVRPGSNKVLNVYSRRPRFGKLFFCFFSQNLFITEVFAKKKGTFIPACFLALHLSCSWGIMPCCFIAARH